MGPFIKKIGWILLVCLLALSAVVAPEMAGAASGAKITEFSAGITGIAMPTGIAAGPDGNLWFTESMTSKIGMITPAGVITEFALPTSPTPWTITAGPDGNLWFTENDANNIGRITPTGMISEFNIPTPSAGCQGIAAGPDGNVWFTESGGDKIGKITPAGVITEYALPTINTNVGSIASGPDGNLWFVETGAYKIGKITPTGTITEYQFPTTAYLGAITAGPDNNVWFVDNSTVSQIGKITPAGVVTEYPIPGASGIDSIISGQDGNLWFTEYDTGTVGMITTRGVVTQYLVPWSAEPYGIAAGQDGNLWFADQHGAVGRLSLKPPSFISTTTNLQIKMNAAAADISGLLHVNDSDIGKTLAWSQAAAPSKGGTLVFNGATAATGSADITPGGTITYQPATGYTGTETFTVQVSDGVNTDTRTITVGIANTNLRALGVKNGTTALALTPAIFDPATTSYATAVASTVTSVTVTPTVADSTATVTVNGTVVASGVPSGAIALVTGVNAIPIVVTSKDGSTTNTYTVNVTRTDLDGSGSLAVTPSPAPAIASKTGQTFTFTYTAAAGGMSGGEVDIPVSALGTVGTVTASSGTVTYGSGVIKVTGVTLAGGGTLTVTWSGATVVSSAGTKSIAATQKSTAAGTLKALSPAPTAVVVQKPTATTSAGTSPTGTGETLNGSVNDNGAITTVGFDYGTSTAYGSSAAATTNATIPAGSGSKAVSVILAGLKCGGITYHFRVNATNSAGTSNGSDLTFTTATVCPAVVDTPNAHVGANLATLTLKSDSTGTGYFTLLKGGNATCGTSAQVQAGKDSTGAQAVARGSLPLTAATQANYTVRNLLAGTAYTACFTADKSGTFATPVAANFTTAQAASWAVPGWQTVGSAGFTAGYSNYLSLAFAPDGAPYVAYQDGGSGGKESVMKYDGSNWAVVGGVGFSTGMAGRNSLAFAPDGTPYVAYPDFSNQLKATVMKYSGAGWTAVGAPGGFSLSSITNISLAFAPNGKPYVTFDDGNCNKKATVMSFDGTGWGLVGNAGFTAGQVANPSLAFAPDGTPHVAYADMSNSNKLTVMKYNGTSWVVVGSAGLSAGQADSPTLAFAPDGTLYVAYGDGDGSTFKSTVMKYDGTTWGPVGAAGFSAGAMQYISLAFAPDDTPYVSYTDRTSSSVTVMAYNGTAWGVIGSAGFAPTLGSGASLAVAPDGTPYVANPDPMHQNKVTCMRLANVPTAPVVTTSAATNVSATGATLHATVNTKGADTTLIFDYGGTGYGNTTPSVILPQQSADQPSAVTVSNLSCNTLYHFRANGNNGIGTTTNGQDLTFTTGACPAAAPVAVTSAAVVAASGVTLNGTVSANASATAVSFEYGTTIGYGTMIVATQITLAPTSGGNTPVSAPLTDPACNTTYHFRVLATNTLGSATGSDQTFASQPCAPVIGAPAVAPAAGMATFSLQSDHDGTGWLTLLKGNNAACGSGDQVRSGLDATGAPAPYHGSLPLSAGVAGSYTLRNLTASTPYTLCFTADQGGDAAAPAAANLTTTAMAAYTPPNWSLAGSAGFSAGTIGKPMLNFAPDGTPYFAYLDIANSQKVTVMRYVNGAWSAVGGAGFTASTVTYFSLAFGNDGVPYVAYYDNSNGGRATVMRFSGGAWSTVGSAGFTPGPVGNISVAIAPDGSPHVLYLDSTMSLKATVMRFSGGAWSTVGNAGFSPTTFNVNTCVLAFAPDGTAYALLPSNVMKFDGTNWVQAGGVLSNLNISAASFAFAPDGTPHVSFVDNANASQAVVMKLNGGVWTQVGPGVFGDISSTALAFAPDGTPYLTYPDTALATMGKETMLRYDGSSWSAVGARGFSPSSVDSLSLSFSPDGTPWVGFMDGNQNTYKATVMRLTPPFVAAPSATTGVASAMTSGGATLNGIVNGNGTDATTSFDYGTSTAYNLTASGATAPAVGGNTAILATVSGLTCNTVYHFRINGVNGGGTTNGSDATFTTAACSSNAGLTALALSSSTLAPAFDGTVTGYAVSVANGVAGITVTPTLADATATVKVDGTLVASGSASGSINLAVGANTVTVLVTAQDGTTKTYTVTVTRALAPVAPAITSQPSAVTIASGANTSFGVSATGTTLSYQWQVNTGSGFADLVSGGAYAGATTATLSITGATAVMNGYSYRCVVTGDTAPAATSNGATLTVNTPPAITTQPLGARVQASGTTSFTVAATGLGPLTYQWQVSSDSGTTFSNVTDGGVYSGATTATLTITGATLGMNGYFFRVVVSGALAPAATSNKAGLMVSAVSFPILSGNWSAPWSSPGGDATVSGATLTLTPNVLWKSGYLFFTEPFSSSLGINATFDFYDGGGDGADGFSFFLIDGSYSPTQPGMNGSGLGYSTTSNTGLAGGWVGIGFDEWGGFSSTAGGTSGSPSATTNPQTVAVRGKAPNYAYITKANPSFPISGGNRKVNITVDKNQNMTVQIKNADVAGSAWETVINGVSLGQTAPAFFKLGFAGSTGGKSDLHQVSNVTVTLPGDDSITGNSLPSQAANGGTVGFTLHVCPQNITSLQTDTKATVSVTPTGMTLTQSSYGPYDLTNGCVDVPVSGTVTAAAGGSYSYSASVSSGDAAFGDVNLSDNSTTQSGTVLVPQTVSTGSASGVTSTGATLNGSVNANTGGAATTVSFQYGTDTTYGTETAATSNATVLAGAGAKTASLTLSGLSCGGTYHFRVKGVNVTGTVNGSDASFTTPVCAPSTLAAPTATAGDAKATVAFTPPATTGGAPITGYTVTSNPGGLTGSGTASPITVNGLTNGTAYTFTVTATNGTVTSVASVASNSVTPVALPGAPTSVTAVAGNAQATVTFSAPASTGGSPITGYTVTSTPGGLTVSGAASPLTFTGLSNGVTYTFAVAATTAVGTGPVSSASAGVTPKAPQMIGALTLQPDALSVGTKSTVIVTATSGLDVSVASATTDVCTVGNNTITAVSAGTCTITADQAGNGAWAAATRVTKDVTVTKASQNVNFPKATVGKIYGAPDFSAGVTACSGLALTYASSDASVATVDVASGVIHIVGAGSATITASQAGDASYLAASASMLLTVEKTVLTVTAANKSRVYGDADPVFSATYSGFVNGEDASVLTGQPAFTTTATAASMVGSYPITPAQGTLSAANYSFAFVDGTLAVGLNSQSITFNPIPAKTYGGPSFTLFATGGASGTPVVFTSSNPAVATVSGATVTIVGAGSTTITASQEESPGYAFASAQQLLTVNKAPLMVTAWDAERRYGESDPVFGVSYQGFVAGEDQTVLSGTPSIATSATSASPTGSYPIFPSAGTLTAANYRFVFNPGTLAVNLALQPITFAPITAKTYGDASFAPGATGGGSGNPIVYESSSPAVATVSGSNLVITGAGQAMITAKQAGNDYYAEGRSIQILTVNPAKLTVKADDASRAFGAANPSFSVSYSGFAAGDDASKLKGAPVSATIADTASAAGSYPITVAEGNLSSANYDFNYLNGTLTVTKIPATATLDATSLSRTFDGTAKSATATTTPAGLYVEFSYSDANGYPVASPTAAGSYAVTGTILDPGYSGSASGTLTIAKSNQTVAFPGAAVSKTYGNADFGGGASASSGLGVTYASSDAQVATVTAGGLIHIVGAGTATITASQAGSGNFNPASATMALTVQKAKLTVTADNAARAAGVADPQFSASYSGFVNGEGASVVTGPLAFTTTATGASPAGSYAITPVTTGLVAANYTFASVDGVLAVALSSQNIVFNPPAPQTYGAPPFELAATGGASGNPVTFASSDPQVATVSGTTVTITGAGEAVITASQAGNASYGAATAQRTLTVAKAPLMVTAVSASRVYNTPNPAFTASYSGFVNGDDQSVLSGAPDVTTAAGLATPTGSYPIVASQGTLDALNYRFLFAPGTLGVNLATQVITFNPLTARNYGDAPFDPGATGDASGNPVVYQSSNPAVATVTGNVIAVTGAGEAIITANQDGNYNYASATAQQVLTVAPAKLTVIANDASRAFGVANPAFSAGYSGFVNNETAAVLKGAPLFSSSADASSPSGAYPITTAAGNLFSANYDFSYQDGVLVVGSLTPVITWSAPSAIGYGTPLGAAQLNAVADVAGTFSYTPATGSMLNTGVGQVLSVTFTPTDAVNYGAASATATIDVAKATQVISFGSVANPTVGGTSVLSATGGGSGNPVTFASTTPGICSVAGSTVTGLASGACGISADQAGGPNYNPATQAVLNLTVGQSTATVALAGLNQTYDGTAKAATASTTPAGLNVTVTYDGAATVPVQAGSYQVVATVNDANYTGTAGGTLTIARASQTVSFVDAAVVKTYGNADFGPGASASTGLPVSYASSDSTVATVTAGGLLHIVGAGTATITAGQAGDANHNAATASQVLTVKKATLAVTAANSARVFAASDPSFGAAYSGFVNGEDATVLTGAPAFSSGADSNSPPGSYAITPSAGTLSAANYDFTFAPGTLAVGIASQNIVFNPLAGRPYGDAPFTLSATGGASGLPVTFASSDPAVAVIDGSTVTIVGAGSTVITANQAGNGNFASATAQQTLMVNKAKLMVTAVNAERFYNQPNPSLSVTYAGFVAGETQSVLSGAPAVATTADLASPVGSYPIMPTAGTLAAANYEFLFAPATLAVNLASQTIDFAPVAAKTYGAADFDLAATGGASGNPIVFSSTNPAVATVSGSTVTVTGAGEALIIADQQGTGNYASATARQLLRVAPAALTVTVADASRVYGADNPSFSVSYGGFVNGETIAVLKGAPVLSTSADATSPVGAYPVAVAAGNLFSGNYTFGFVNGTLAVGQATPVITWSAPSSIAYGTPLGSSQLNAAASVAGVFSYIPAAGSVLNAGVGQVLSVAFTPADAANYGAASATVAIDVVKAAQSVTFGPVVNPAVGGTSAIIATGGGSGNAVTFSSTTPATCSVAGSVVTGLSAGACGIVADQAGGPNHNPAAQVVLNLTVSQATATVTLAGLSQTYDGRAKSATATTAPAGLSVAITYDGSATAPIHAGSYHVDATVSDVNYSGNASGTLTIAKQSQNLVVGPTSAVVIAGSAQLTVTASSGPAVSFSSTTPAVCTVSGSTLTGVALGNCAITASQGGSADYLAATAATLSFPVGYNGAPPTLAVSALSDGAVTTETTQNISGRVFDPNGIAALTVNGQDVQVNGDGSFSYPVQLLLGANTVTVVAVNKAGAATTDIRTLTLDTTAPKLSVSYPPDNAIAVQQIVTVTGKISSLLSGTAKTTAKAVASAADPTLTITWSANGAAAQAATIAEDSYSFTTNLGDGMNTIRVYAANAAGQKAEAKRTVTYQPAFSDTVTDPTFSIAVSDPDTDAHLALGSYLLKGVVTGNTTPVTVTVAMDGQSFTPAVDASGAFSQQLEFPQDKTYQIQVTGVDQNGNSLSVPRNIIHSAPKAVAGDGSGTTGNSYTIVDALLALQMTAGIMAPDNSQILRLDVAPMVGGVSMGDGKVDIEDVVVILRMVLGLIQ